MAVIKVTSEDLQATSASLKTAAEQIKTTSEQAKKQVEALVSAGWTGTASSAFDQAFMQWKSGADQVDIALARIGELLNNAAQSYDSTEQSITSSFG
jgi:WXG100 family type VII secretion target